MIEGISNKVVEGVLGRNVIRTLWMYIGSVAGIFAILGLPRGEDGIPLAGKVGSSLLLPAGFEDAMLSVHEWIITQTSWLSMATVLAMSISICATAFGEKPRRHNQIPNGPAAATFLVALITWQSTNSATWVSIASVAGFVIIIWLLFFIKTSFMEGIMLSIVEIGVVIFGLPITLFVALFVPDCHKAKSDNQKGN